MTSSCNYISSQRRGWTRPFANWLPRESVDSFRLRHRLPRWLRLYRELCEIKLSCSLERLPSDGLLFSVMTEPDVIDRSVECFLASWELFYFRKMARFIACARFYFSFCNLVKVSYINCSYRACIFVSLDCTFSFLLFLLRRADWTFGYWFLPWWELCGPAGWFSLRCVDVPR